MICNCYSIHRRMKHECVMGHKLWFAFTLETKASSDYILRPCEEYDTICFFF